MIPQTYPSTVSVNTGNRQMVVFYLSSIVGLTRWVDYIPVRTVQNEISTEGNTNANGYVAIDELASSTGKTAWVDYIPVYEDGAATTAWTTDTTGYIPVGLSGAGSATLNLNFAYAKTLDSRITFTRASTATYFDASGVLQSASNNVARFDHDPSTLVSKGLLIEEARTNLVLNSLLDGTNLSTQSVTVAAVAHTLSFYGTGTITLSGTSTAGPLVGTGNTTRVSLTFTPTAGSLTLTVSGTVKWCNLEVGAFATSFVPTAGTSLTRAADVASMTGTNFSDWFNASEGTFVCRFLTGGDLASANAFSASGADSSLNAIRCRISAGGALDAAVITGGAAVSAPSFGSVSANTQYSIASAYKANDFAATSSGGTVQTDAAGALPTVDRLYVGQNSTGEYLGGHIARLTYYPKRLSNTVLQGLSL